LKVFEKRFLRRILGLKRNEMVGGWRKLHDETLYNLYTLPNIIRMIKSSRTRWAGHVTSIEQRHGNSILVVKARRKETSRKTQT
jgi:hypothetical protein